MDPIWWTNEILGVTLFPAQEEIMREFYQNRYNPKLPQYKQLILVAGMRSGKTALASIMGCYEFWDAITMPNPAEHYKLLKNQKLFIQIVSVSEKQASDGVFSNIQTMIEGCEWLHTWFDIEVRSDNVECDAKRVKLQTLSSWATTAVGRTSKCVIFDELALFESTGGKRGAWEIWSRLKKSTDTLGDDGHVIAISSPQHPTDIIMRLHMEGKAAMKREYEIRTGKIPIPPNYKPNNFLTYKRPTWEMNPHFSEAALREEYKRDMPTFYRDYACKPEIAGGVAFPEGVFLKPMVNILQLEEIPLMTDQFRVLAIDPAVTNDRFGIACGYTDRMTGGIVVDGAHRFTKREGDAFIRPSEIRKYLDYVIPRINANVFIFDTWMYPEIIEHVVGTYGMEYVKHIVSKEDYDRWKEQQSEDYPTPVRVVYDEQLKYEAENLLVINERTPKVDHPFGGSKDTADCVANVIWYLSTMQPTNLLPDSISLRVI